MKFLPESPCFFVCLSGKIRSDRVRPQGETEALRERKLLIMKQFQYTVTDPLGIHARPAGMLVKAAKALDSTVTIAKEDGSSAVATKLMAVMGLAIKTGNTVTVTIEGGDEEANAAAMEQFFKENV